MVSGKDRITKSLFFPKSLVYRRTKVSLDRSNRRSYSLCRMEFVREVAKWYSQLRFRLEGRKTISIKSFTCDQVIDDRFGNGLPVDGHQVDRCVSYLGKRHVDWTINKRYVLRS